MSTCVKVKPITLCPVCGKGERAEIETALGETQAQIERLKKQARAWKSKLRSIDRKATKAASPTLAAPTTEQAQPNAQA